MDNDSKLTWFKRVLYYDRIVLYMGSIINKKQPLSCNQWQHFHDVWTFYNIIKAVKDDYSVGQLNNNIKKTCEKLKIH